MKTNGLRVSSTSCYPPSTYISKPVFSGLWHRSDIGNPTASAWSRVYTNDTCTQIMQTYNLHQGYLQHEIAPLSRPPLNQTDDTSKLVANSAHQVEMPRHLQRHIAKPLRSLAHVSTGQALHLLPGFPKSPKKGVGLRSRLRSLHLEEQLEHSMKNTSSYRLRKLPTDDHVHMNDTTVIVTVKKNEASTAFISNTSIMGPKFFFIIHVQYFQL